MSPRSRARASGPPSHADNSPEPAHLDQVVDELKRLANPDSVAGMARYGINPEGTLGVSIPTLRKLAKSLGKNHGLAEALWASGIHEARILAGFIDDPAQVTDEQMDRWVADFDSWDVCDQVCCNLFDRTALAAEKPRQWALRDEEFVKRAGFTMIAALAWHDKKAPDSLFIEFLPLIKEGSTDERNFVKKAVNWALRHIGKRNRALNAQAIEVAREIEAIDSKSARWVARDALRELTGEAVQRRLR